MLRTALVLLLVAVVWLIATARADASPYIRYGIQDDAWLLGGPGTFEERLTTVEELGVDVVRVNVRWQSGLYTFHEAPKLSAAAFRFPLPQIARRGSRVTLWGQPSSILPSWARRD